MHALTSSLTVILPRSHSCSPLGSPASLYSEGHRVPHQSACARSRCCNRHPHCPHRPAREAPLTLKHTHTHTVSCPLPPAAPNSHGHSRAIRPHGLDHSVAASSPKPQHCGVLCPSHCVPHTSGCGLCSTPPSSHLAHRADSIFLWLCRGQGAPHPGP